MQSCVGKHSCYELKCAMACEAQTTASQSISPHCLALTCSPVHCFWALVGVGCDRSHLTLGPHSHCAQYFEWQRLCINPSPLLEETSMKRLNFTQIWQFREMSSQSSRVSNEFCEEPNCNMDNLRYVFYILIFYFLCFVHKLISPHFLISWRCNLLISWIDSFSYLLTYTLKTGPVFQHWLQLPANIWPEYFDFHSEHILASLMVVNPLDDGSSMNTSYCF